MGGEMHRRAFAADQIHYAFDLANVVGDLQLESADVLRATGLATQKLWSARSRVSAI
jgi:hypothetical protein